MITTQSKPSVIALTGKRWKNKNEPDLFCFEGYQRPFAGTRNRKRGRGVTT